MVRADVIYLIAETEQAHGVHATVERSERMVYCQIRSVSRSEFYTALNAGIQPEYVFVLSVADEWQGERYLRYRDRVLRVLRTYEPDDGSIEITAGRGEDE